MSKRWRRDLSQIFIQCCKRRVASVLIDWLGLKDTEDEWDHRTERRCSLSKNEFEREKIALESEVTRGITTQTAADEKIGKWAKDEANDRYTHQDELRRRLAGDDDEETHR